MLKSMRIQLKDLSLLAQKGAKSLGILIILLTLLFFYRFNLDD
jgi:hypothetical protein